MATKRTLGNPTGNSGEGDHYRAHETRRNLTVPPVTPRPINMSRPRIPEINTQALVLPSDELRLMMEREATARQSRIDHPNEAVEEVETAILPHRPTAQEIDDLKANWLVRPVYDIEFAVGFETVFNELAAWHDQQIWLKAKTLGCSHLMSSILEELVRCWITNEPPRSAYAQRFLASYA